MTIKRILILSLALLLGQSNLKAQTLDEGFIKMELIDVEVTSPEMQQMVGAMKGATQEIYFSGGRQKVVMEMMGGMMKIQMYQDFNDNTTVNYMDVMGQKMITTIDAEHLDKLKIESQKMMGDAMVIYDKSDVKDIMGYKCHKASLSAESQGQQFKMIFYVTDKIKVPKAFIQNMNHLNLKGTPLQWELQAKEMKMTYQAKEISDKIASNFFDKPEGDYSEMSMEQLKQMGMQNQLGF